MDWNPRNIFTWFVAGLLMSCGFVRRAKRRAMRGDFILSVYFHNPTKTEFEGCIKWLRKNNFTFLSMEDLDEIRQKDLPLPKGGVLLTFDDGWQSNEENVVEIANKYKVPVTIFVSSEPIEQGSYWWTYLETAEKYKADLPLKISLKKAANSERVSIINILKKEFLLPREAMTVEQIQRISASEYVTIGGHTHSHPILINCGNDEVYSELKLSKDKIESWTGKDVPYFAYPNGDYSAREMKTLSKLSYRMAFTCEPKHLTKECLKNNFELPRFGLLEGVSLAENICRMVGVWKPLMIRFRHPRRRHSTAADPVSVLRKNLSEMAAM